MAVELTPDLERLKLEAEGRKAFKTRPVYEALAALDLVEYRRLDPPTRLALGYYQTAQRRAESMKGGA